MRTFRRLMIAIVAIGIIAAATPSFAQTSAPTSAPLKLKIPSFAPSSVVPVTPTAPTRVRLMRVQDDEQGLGVFVQAGWVRAMQRGGDQILPSGAFDDSFNGYLFGISFGGNKSGHFGLGADVNYMVKGADNVWFFDTDNEIDEVGTLKRHYLQIPVWARINFMGQSTKEAPTLYVMFGGFADILLKGEINDIDIKEHFNGVDFGPLVGVGFEVVRIVVEFRVDWTARSLKSTGGGTFLNGLEKSRDVSMLLLFKVRLN